jgi:hypothetical protein
MGTVNATPLSAEPITTLGEYNIFMDDLFVGELEVGQPSCAPGRFASFSYTHAARGQFPASRGVLFLTHPEEVGGDEVKQ